MSHTGRQTDIHTYVETYVQTARIRDAERQDRVQLLTGTPADRQTDR